MKLKKKIKAFTIMELLVTLVLTSIIVSLASSIYLNMQKYFSDSEAAYEKNSDINFLIGLIKNDFENASSVVSSFGLITLISNDSKMLEYNFGDEYIIRKKEYQRDTFYVKTEELDIIRLDNNSDLVTEIKADIIIDDGVIPFHIYKSYTRDILFNLYQNKE
jgi:competence protein ComGF